MSILRMVAFLKWPLSFKPQTNVGCFFGGWGNEIYNNHYFTYLQYHEPHICVTCSINFIRSHYL